MNVSLVVPVRNEERSIERLLDSIRRQTRRPDEIVIVDGGSTDGTVELARSAGEPGLRVIEAGEATPGRGRNIGIAAAQHAWVALTDAGIELEPTWLERLLDQAQADPEVGIVYGNIEPQRNTFFERCAALAYVPPKRLTPNGRSRGPSVASCLLRRDVWQAVGGFPDLRAAEDLIFMERVKEHGVKAAHAPEATAHWQLQPSLARTFAKFVLYSKHNVLAGRQRYWHYGIARMYAVAMVSVLLAIFHNPGWLALILLGGAARTAKSIWSRRDQGSWAAVLNPFQFILVGLILLTIDVATFAGWWQAITSRKRSSGKTSLYICYQSLLDPLTQTQVIAYLEGLALSGYRMVLMTFEPQGLAADRRHELKEQLQAKGITWHGLRYHKRPTVPATAWDILMGILVGLWLAWRHRVHLVHARSHVPGVMGLVLKRLAGVRLLFDLRGLMAEEYVDAGVWPQGGWLFRLTKRMERRLIRRADGIVVLTEKARELLTQWYGEDLRDKPLAVIPCCVDLRANGDDSLPNPNGHRTFVYVGKLGGWYLTEQMADFMTMSLGRLPDLQWQVWTQSDADPLRRLLTQRGVEQRVQIGRMAADRLSTQLRQAHAGLAFIKPCRSKLASSPTKVGEYLAAGLPVIANAGIGDLDQLLGNGKRVGVLVEPYQESGLSAGIQQIVSLLDDPDVRQRCRRVAQQELDLVGVGWKRDRAMYQALIGLPSPS